jgi:hypothetical protein
MYRSNIKNSFYQNDLVSSRDPFVSLVGDSSLYFVRDLDPILDYVVGRF